jgi:peroxiredoxin
MSKPRPETLEEAFARCCDMDASLAERLQAFADAVGHWSPAFQEAVDRLVGRLKEHEVGKTSPRPGETMPPFVLPDENGRLVSLDAMLEKGPMAIIFHRGHWCPYCRLNTVALSKAQEEIMAEGGQVVAIMPDRAQFAAELKSESKAPFPILADIDNGYALSLNLVFWVGGEMEQLISAAGWDIPSFQGNNSWMLPIPATFVVGTDGCIRARFVDPDYRKRMEVEDLLAALKTAH